jgi:predicted nucleic-acid-binding protein
VRGLDTNVLVRFLTADDPDQSEACRRLIEQAEASGGRLHLSTLVIAELVWVLSGSRYTLSRSEVADILDDLLNTAVFVIQDRDLVRRATAAFRVGPADFSDFLIGESDRQAGCTATLTFDRRLLTAEGFEEPAHDFGGPSRVSEP